MLEDKAAQSLKPDFAIQQRIQEEENLSEAYAQTAHLETSVDDEINKAIGTTDIEIQNSLVK